MSRRAESEAVGEFVGFIAFLLLAASCSGVVGLIFVSRLRSRIRTLEFTVDRLSASLRVLQQESAARHKEVQVPAAEAHPPSPAPMPAVPKSEPLRAGVVPAAEVPAVPAPPAPPGLAPQRESSLESLESTLGTRWLSWIGALVVLVGLAFLLKYLYDRGWVGPAGRVGVGLALGVGLLIMGEIRLRRVHDLLSQSVSAAGCGALFLTTFLAYKFYDFSGRFPTFLMLCWFAGFTVALAVARNGRILAFLGLLGAYLTPYLLSTGQDQAEALFSYLAVLAIAGLFVTAARGWLGIPSLCLILTLIYYIGWYSRFYSPQRMVVASAGAGGIIIFMSALGLGRGLWNRSAIRIEECLAILSSALIGVFYLWEILAPEYPRVLGLVLCGVALVALAGLRASRLRSASNDNLESTLLLLAAGSLLLVIPACLKAGAAMLAWALAAVILAEIGIRSRRTVLEAAAAVSLAASLIVGIAEPVSHSGVFRPIVNGVFIPWFGAILAWFVAGARGTRAYQETGGRRLTGVVLQIASCFMLLALLSYETAAWFGGYLELPGADSASLREWRTTALCLLWSLYPALWVRRSGAKPERWNLAATHYAVMGIAMLTLLPEFHRQEVVVFLNPPFLAASLFPMGVFLVSRRLADSRGRIRNALQIYGHVFCVILLSVELYQGLFLPPSYEASRYWIRMALISACWGIYATAVLAIGISRDFPAWRWLALLLLGVTLVKVFFVDMAEVQQIWRVLSFLVLGALLMACSYAYTRREHRRKSEAKPPEKELEVSR